MPEPSQKVTYLSAMEVFRDLSPEDMAWLDSVTTSFTCPRGRILYTPGESGEVLFLLKKGQVSIYRLSLEGKKMVLATLSANTLFGEMALVGQGMYDSFAEAAEESELCTMSRGDLERLIVTKPAVGLRLLEATSRRLLEAEAALEDMAFKHAPGRLAGLLLRVAEEQGGGLVVGLSHQDLAERLAMFRETVTQLLNDFKAQGLVSLGRRHITIADPSGLREIAGA